jgi:hypothetical protein
VIQIASMVTVQGESKPTVRNVMTLKKCAPIVGAEVMSFEDETGLLRVSRTPRRPASSFRPSCPPVLLVLLILIAVPSSAARKPRGSFKSLIALHCCAIQSGRSWMIVSTYRMRDRGRPDCSFQSLSSADYHELIARFSDYHQLTIMT